MKTRKMLSLSIKGIIVIQAILCLFMTLFFLSESYQKKILNYETHPSTSFKIHLKGVDKERADVVWNYLLNQDAAIVQQSLEESNSVTKIKILIGGNIKKAPDFKFLGITLVNTSDLVKLSRSTNPDATIGQKNGSINSIKQIQHIMFSCDPYFAKLAENTDVTSLGSYSVIGFTDLQRENFMNELVTVSGLSKEKLSTETNGFSASNGIIGAVIILCLLVTLFILGVLITLYTMASFKEIGTLSLLGWNKVNLITHEFANFITFSLVTTVINLIMGYLISGLGFTAISYYAASGVTNTLLIILLVIISSSLILSISSLSAIRGKIPKKTLYSLATVLYLFLSIGLVTSCKSFDEPVQQIQHNRQLLHAWSNVVSYETFKTLDPGENKNSIIGIDYKLASETYNWYKSVEGKDGVYIAYGNHYSKETLAISPMGTKTPYSMLKFSPNYLRNHNIKLSYKDEQAAENGVRIYMIPDDWNEKRIDHLKKDIFEHDLKPGSIDDIDTKFTRNQSVKFIRYHVKEPIFTWIAENNQPTLDKSPIILISTTANMNFFDRDSLYVGMLNGSVKFKNKIIAERYTKKSIIEKYDLDDNKLSTLPVEKHVDSLQKELRDTIILFCSVIMLIVLAILLIVLSITFIFSITNERVIFIKEILGFSKIQIYWKLLAGIVVVGAIELLAAVLLNYQFGILLILFNIITQLLVLYLFIKVHGVKKAKES